MDRNELLEIIQVGIRAASAYNGQPWKFRLRGDELDVYLIRTKNFFLKLEGISFMEAGTLLENISEGAQSKGYRTDVKSQACVFGLDEPFMTLKFVKHDIPPRPIGHVLGRNTNRKIYETTPPAKDFVDRFQKMATDGNVRIAISTGKEQKKLAKLLARLERIRLSNFYLVWEMVRFIRMDEKDSEKNGDLLDIRTLELNTTNRFFLMLFSRVRKLFYFFKLLGYSRIRAKDHRRHLENSGALLTFLIKDRSHLGFVQLGRLIQRVMNFLQAEGWHSMPVLSGLYLIDVLQENAEVFSLKEMETIRYCQGRLNGMFSAAGEKPAFMIRTGLGEAPSMRSFRRNIDRFLLP